MAVDLENALFFR